jgi:uncharacterized phage protein (predicted DNA packaging)
VLIKGSFFWALLFENEVVKVAVSDVTVQNIKDYARIEHATDDAMIGVILSSAKEFIKSYTGLDDDAVDEKSDLVIVLYVLAVEMYENRQYTVQNDKLNPVVSTILSMHSINLL